MAIVFRSGANYNVTILDRVVSCRVWQRPDLTREEGARCAEEKIELLSGLARHRMWSLLFDLSAAPPAWGPVTHAALQQILAPWEEAGRAVVVVVGPEAIQRLTVQRLISEACPTVGQLALDRETGLEIAMGANARRPGNFSRSLSKR